MVTINTNISALVSQANLEKADTMSSASIARLSSGNRIIRAADDAAGLAVGTGLRTDVSTLRTAMTNTSQANSLLSLADGALVNIGEILQRQKALASQANSGSLSSQERIFLDQEFQNLTSEIDRIASTTNFNGITLLDGSISGAAGITSDTTGSDAIFTSTVTLDSANAIGDADSALFSVNGIAFSLTDTENTDVNLSATGINIEVQSTDALDGTNYDTTTAAGLADEIAYIINNIETVGLGVTNQAKIDALKGLSATSTAGVLTITSDNNGIAGTFSVTKDVVGTTEIASVSAGTVTVTGNDSVTSVSTNTTDTSGSLGEGSVTASGTVGDNVITSVVSTAATLTRTILTGDLQDADTLTVFGRQFTLRDTVTDSDNEIQRGTTDRETITNVVEFLNSSVDPTLSRFYYDATDESNLSLRITAKTDTNKLDTTYDFTDGTGTANLTAGDGGGIDVSTITDNASFVGAISGFSAEYRGTDSVLLEVTVGDYTYQGVIDDTTPGADTAVRLYSTDKDGKGGYFTVELSNGNGSTVTSQATADTYATRINDAFSSLQFQQNRSISSFDTSNTLLDGGRVYLTSETFAEQLDVSSVDVRQATSTNSNQGAITLNLDDGRIFENTSLGRKIHEGERITLTNRDNSNEFFTIIAGSRMINLDNAGDVSSLQADLVSGFRTQGGGLDFQVGIDSSDTIALTISGVDTNTLYANQTLDVLTVSTSTTAGNQLDSAIDSVTSLRAKIGSLQSRFDFAAANLETSIQNTDAARSDFLDDDVATTSTTFAKSQVLLQASISVLAQANQLPQNLLKLIG